VAEKEGSAVHGRNARHYREGGLRSGLVWAQKPTGAQHQFPVAVLQAGFCRPSLTKITCLKSLCVRFLLSLCLDMNLP